MTRTSIEAIGAVIVNGTEYSDNELLLLTHLNRGPFQRPMRWIDRADMSVKLLPSLWWAWGWEAGDFVPEPYLLLRCRDMLDRTYEGPTALPNFLRDIKAHKKIEPNKADYIG